jgi:predicted ATPase
MSKCGCSQLHRPRRVVLTGGPGAGKTAVLELIRKAMCRHVRVLPESAGIVFGGGFPRSAALPLRRAAQRAIFYVQRELEDAVQSDDLAIVLCDRGTIDGFAYWPGPDELWTSLGTSLAEQYARYDTVIHLRTPTSGNGYNYSNPLRIETAAEAAALDLKIAEAWAGHPRRFEVPAADDFLTKATRAIAIARGELPVCCRAHVPESPADTRSATEAVS